MKEDAPTPAQVPRKRRQLEAALDRWLVEWLRDDLTPSERRRVEEERERRRRLNPRVVVGFSGTRAGMTPQQRKTVTTLLRDADELHHGDCVGADEQAHGLAYNMRVPIVLHPPADARLRAHCKGAERAEPARPYLERNKDIVRECTVLVATPKEGREPPPAPGQGTWSTVRYARGRGVALRVVLPSGELQEEAS